MKGDTTDGWEKEFEERFSMPEFSGEFIKHGTYTLDITDFIKSLLSSERQRMVEKVEKMNYHDYVLAEDFIDLIKKQ